PAAGRRAPGDALAALNDLRETTGLRYSRDIESPASEPARSVDLGSLYPPWGVCREADSRSYLHDGDIATSHRGDPREQCCRTRFLAEDKPEVGGPDLLPASSFDPSLVGAPRRTCLAPEGPR